jgi:hypothetical protein
MLQRDSEKYCIAALSQSAVCALLMQDFCFTVNGVVKKAKNLYPHHRMVYNEWNASICRTAWIPFESYSTVLSLPMHAPPAIPTAVGIDAIYSIYILANDPFAW